LDGYSIAQAVIAMFVITSPPDAVKVLLFNSTIDREGMSRTPAAVKVSLAVLAILGGSALFGDELLGLLGIQMPVFSIVGGVMVASMGFEMLYGGAPSRTQGQSETTPSAQEEGGLFMPLATPLIAGPGAIVTVITIASADPESGSIVALIAAGVVAIITFVSPNFLGQVLERASARGTAFLMRIGGLLLAAIGTQMLLEGLKQFFGTSS
jgi:multiple antibiotic resistance protein